MVQRYRKGEDHRVDRCVVEQLRPVGGQPSRGMHASRTGEGTLVLLADHRKLAPLGRGDIACQVRPPVAVARKPDSHAVAPAVLRSGAHATQSALTRATPPLPPAWS